MLSVSEPVGQIIEKRFVAGDNVTISCSVDYAGPETPYIEWTDDADEVVTAGATEWTESDNETNPDNATLTFASVSELSVFVPDDAEFLPSYTCSVRFYSYNQRPQTRKIYNNYNNYFGDSITSYSWYRNVYTPYNWTSAETKVSCE